MKNTFLIIISLFLISCSKENETAIVSTESSKSLADFFSIFNVDTKNKIIITNFSHINDVTTNSTISYKSFSVNDNKIVNLNNMSFLNNNSEVINGYTIWQYNDNRLTEFFGRNVGLKLSENNHSIYTIENENDNIEVYLPEIINVTISGLNGGRVQAGTMVTWNVDPNNSNGVVLAIEYLPHLQPDEDVRDLNPEVIYEGKVINDNGYYTITSADLEKYPDNATLTLYIGRASIVITNDGDIENDTSIGAYTYRSADFTVKK